MWVYSHSLSCISFESGNSSSSVLEIFIELFYHWFYLPCFFYLPTHRVPSCKRELSGPLFYFLFFFPLCHFALLSGRFPQLYLLTSLLHDYFGSQKLFFQKLFLFSKLSFTIASYSNFMEAISSISLQVFILVYGDEVFFSLNSLFLPSSSFICSLWLLEAFLSCLAILVVCSVGWGELKCWLVSLRAWVELINFEHPSKVM